MAQIVLVVARSKGKILNVSAWCLGPVKTGFQERGDLKGVKTWDKAKAAEQCAKIGYKGMEKGELVIFNEDQLKWMLNWVALFMSRKIVLKISRQFMEK